MRIPRRRFIQGCCAAGWAAASGSQLSSLAFAQTPDLMRGDDTLIVIFLRGGMDALSFLIPHSDPNYHEARPRLGLRSDHVIDLDGQFGLHPSATPIRELWQERHLALIAACGLPEVNRSHFEAQDLMDRASIGGGGSETSGWLARHMRHATQGEIIEAVSLGTSVATSLEQFGGALAMTSPEEFTLGGDAAHSRAMQRALRSMWSQDSDHGHVASRTLDAADLLSARTAGEHPPRHGATYPDTEFGRALAAAARLIRLDIGLQAATVDLGGWDTHENQAQWENPIQGRFANLVDELSRGLQALWTDMTDHHGRLTVAVMSEFGRRLRENSSRGTDHGHAGVMMVLSSDISRREIFGEWPGLESDQLTERADLRVTTDFRTVLSEVMTERLGRSDLTALFPGHRVTQPLGLFRENV
jgi:uncharacterized protein (DUF1501 family)